MWVGGWLTSRPGRFTPSNDPLPIVQEVGRAPGRVWTGAENRALTGIRSPDRSARSESLYRLSYRDPLKQITAKDFYLGNPCAVGQRGLLAKFARRSVDLNDKRQLKAHKFMPWIGFEHATLHPPLRHKPSCLPH
jgi:hypothetical protein